MLYIEAIILGTIGITIGIFIGIMFSIFIIYLMQSFISNFSNNSMSFYIGFKNINITTNNNVKLQYTMPFLILVMVILIVYAIVILSYMIPIKKINKLNIIETIRKNNNDKIKHKNLRTPLIISKMFGFIRRTCMEKYKTRKEKI